MQVIDRATSADLTQLASEVGGVPMQVAGLLVLGAHQGPDGEGLVDVVGRRLACVPRLRQRLERTPWGCGRPVWVDDPHFDVDRHVQLVTSPAPGDERALLDLATGLVVERLPRDRPLWRAAVVTGLERDHVALVLVLHHVVADGVGGLAVLAGLVDGASDASAPVPAPRRPPNRATLARDAWTARVRSVRRAPAGIRVLRSGLQELGHRPPRPVAACSLLRPTSPRRHVDVVRTELEPLRELAHRCGGTVNDALVAVLAGALEELLAARTESVPELVVSVPVSARAATTRQQLGNEVGVMPVAVPTGVGLTDRIAVVAEATAALRLTPGRRGASAAVLDPVFRTLAAAHLLSPVITRQRLVHTFVSNLRGPEHAVQLAGHPVTQLVPLAVVPGNVTVTFQALSYAGVLAISVVTDPDQVPDAGVVVAAVRHQLAHASRDVRDRVSPGPSGPGR